MPKKVAFYTLGCKLNFSETSTISRIFTDNNFEKVEFEEKPDIYVINTCSVTENANRKCRQIVKQARQYSPNAYIAVIGCYAQLKPDEIANIPGVDIVLGAAEKFNLLEHVSALMTNAQPFPQQPPSGSPQRGGERQRARQPRGERPSAGSGKRNRTQRMVKKGKAAIYVSEINHINEFISSFSIGDRTRSFLKVQDGCDYSCSFCTIPLARGKSRSDTIENIVRSAWEIAGRGVKEIVLSGVNIGDFGRTDDMNGRKYKETFYRLIQELDRIKGIERFRISSIEPNLLTDEIIEFVARSKRFMPHFHIPLQSGSNKILRRMRRRYLRELYEDRINTIKKLMPHCCIGVDVIVGFPGETEEEFLETYNFLNQLDISYLHVFTYSERENTAASQMNGVVSTEERSKRSKMLHNLSEKKRRLFYEQNLSKKAIVLFEGQNKGDTMFGFTENYIKVKTQYDPILVNELIEVQLLNIDTDGIVNIENLANLSVVS